MQKNNNQQEIWLDKMLDHVLANGLHSSSLRPLAKAAGTSDRMLIYYYSDKAGLMTAILQRSAARTMMLMAEHGATDMLPFDACLTRTVNILGKPAFEPYLNLFLQIASQAAQGDAFYRKVGEQLGRAYHAWASAQLSSKDEASRSREAAILMQRIEGMIFLKAIGLDDVNDAAFALA